MASTKSSQLARKGLRSLTQPILTEHRNFVNVHIRAVLQVAWGTSATSPALKNSAEINKMHYCSVVRISGCLPRALLA